MNPTFSQILKDPILFLAFGFGSGLMKKAPGTWGTLAGVPVYLAVVYFLPDIMHYLILSLLFFLLGIFICDHAEKKLGLHDPGGIVWDEIVGLLVTMAFLPVTLTWVVAGFVLFRFFDILKPWPIKWFDQKCKGGYGVMVDDVIAGLIACVILNGIQFLL
jgi:phosphatidylglycerophosphatase A